MTDHSDWLLAESLAPAIDGDRLEPLYEGAGRGDLVLPFCGRCSLALDLEQHVCDGCGAAQVQWRPVDRRGVVHSATTMHRLERGLVIGTEPYPIVDVELSSGHRLIVTAIASGIPTPPIGAEVSVGFRHLAGTAVPALALPSSTDTEDDK
ncbi:Zn-ribbon domain-containing OB-fold protein [Gordonia humi]|uniref:Putative OB-fold protein n=1 Tax=Gordonia humi TaxID=686429 RepID=A0A840EY21_9ACTN|nr:OB-fold domain-containing protein [Gordonia humi]MBB4135183.1 putative OB-fold protein [Gordonia humi]